MKGKVIVLGGNGFIGSHIADALVERGYKVSVFDNFAGPSNLKYAHEIKKITGDFVKDEEAVYKAIKGSDFIFHYLATTNPGSSAKKGVLFDAETNLIPTLKVIEYAAKNGVRKIIFPSSGGAVYGKVEKLPVSEEHPLNPQSPYSIHKLAIEKYLYYYNQSFGLNYVVFRISNAYGPRQNPDSGLGFIATSLGKLLRGKKPVIFGDGSVVRDYIYIDDIVKANICAIEKKTDVNIFNLGSGIGYSLNDIIREMSNITGKDVKPKYISARKIDVPKIYLSISRIEKEFSWEPKISIDEGMRRTYKWLEEHIGG